jgi:threonine dehydratase
MQHDQHCITFENIKEAAARVTGVVTRTPLLAAPPSMNVYGKSFFFKVEAMQRTGSFKFRGAFNAVQFKLLETTGPLSVVTHSSGNHAQALALAASMASTDDRPVTATIVMPRGAPAIKQEATRSYGAEVVLVDNTNEAREEEAERIVKDRGSVFIHPSENPRVIAGQGTASLELVEQIEGVTTDRLDAVIIPVGGGGLASGNAVALRGIFGNKIKIILAEPEMLDDAKRSFEAGQRLSHAPDNKLDSCADGLKTTLGPNTWPIIRDLVDDIFTVSEEEILRATKITWEQLKVCIEPSAGVGVAVAMSRDFNLKYSVERGVKTVAVILCGGNVDIFRTAKMMEDMGL